MPMPREFADFTIGKVLCFGYGTGGGNAAIPVRLDRGIRLVYTNDAYGVGYVFGTYSGFTPGERVYDEAADSIRLEFRQ